MEESTSIHTRIAQEKILESMSYITIKQSNKYSTGQSTKNTEQNTKT